MNSNLRIILDARKLGDGGIGVYLANLIDGLCSSAEFESEFKLSLLVRPDCLNAPVLNRNGRRIDVAVEKAPRYSVREYYLLPIRQRLLLRQAALFHSPHFTLPYFLGVPSVVTIHDLIHLRYPRRKYHTPLARQLIHSALRRATHVIAVSEATKRRISYVYPKVRSDISVIPNALPPVFRLLTPAERERFQSENKLSFPFALFVGNDRPHKGFQELIAGWRLFCGIEREQQALPRRLIIVGADYSNEIKRQVTEMFPEGNVSFIGEISTEQLCGLYNLAATVIVPSREEGFGLPALEALSCGAPLLVSAIPSLREVVGDSGWYLENLRAAEIAKSLGNILSATSERERKRSLGIERAKRFSNAETTSLTISVYRSLLAKLHRMGGIGSVSNQTVQRRAVR